MQSVKIRTDVHARTYDKKISKSDYDMLDKLYIPHNEALYKFLGHRIEEWDTTYNNMVGVQKEGNRLKKQFTHRGGDNNLNITFNPSSSYIILSVCTKPPTLIYSSPLTFFSNSFVGE